MLKLSRFLSSPAEQHERGIQAVPGIGRDSNKVTGRRDLTATGAGDEVGCVATELGAKRRTI